MRRFIAAMLFALLPALAHAQAPGCAANANCVAIVRGGIALTPTYPTLAAAFAANQPGDVDEINPSSIPYTDHDITPTYPITFEGMGQTLGSGTGTISGNTLTLSTQSGTWAVNQEIVAPGFPREIYITAVLGGGRYTISPGPAATHTPIPTIATAQAFTTQTSVIIDPAYAWVPGTTASVGNGLVGKGIFWSGRVGAPGTLTLTSPGGVQALVLQDAVGKAAPAGATCRGVTLATGAPEQCDEGCNSAGLWYEGGNVTFNNVAMFHNCDNWVGNGVIYRTGVISLTNVVSEEGGAGDGQSHCLYNGETYSITITGGIFGFCNDGEAIKIRAAYISISGDTKTGDNPAWEEAPWGLSAGNEDTYGSSVPLQMPNGGIATISGIEIYKSQAECTSTLNHWFEEYGGESAPQTLGNSLTQSGDHFEGDHCSGATGLVWNFMDGYSVSITNETIDAGPQGTPAFLVGEGNQSNNGTFAATKQENYPVLADGETFSDATNFQGTTGPQSVTDTGIGILGGNGPLSVLLNGTGQVFAGPGGATLTAGTKATAPFQDSYGDVPSVIGSASAPLANGTEINVLAPGDVVYGTGTSGGYWNMEGHSQTLNLSGASGDCSSQAFVDAGTPAVYPTATVNVAGCGGPGALYIYSGGIWVFNNPTDSSLPPTFAMASPDVAVGPAVVNDVGAGLFFGEAFYAAKTQLDDYSDPSGHSYFNPEGSTAWVITPTNGTIWFWNSTATTASPFESNSYIPANYAAQEEAGIVGLPGSTGKFGFWTQPAVVEVIAGFSGGSLDLTGLNAAHAANTVFSYLGEASGTCSGTTITAADGSKLTGIPACNDIKNAPAAWNDASLTGPNDINGQSGQIIPVPVTLTDGVAANLSGYELVTVTDSGGGTLQLNAASPTCDAAAPILFVSTAGNVTTNCSPSGTSITVMGNETTVAAALVGLTDTIAGNGSIEISYWNEGGFETTLEIPVTSGVAILSCTPQTRLVGPVAPGTQAAACTPPADDQLTGVSPSSFAISGNNVDVGASPLPPGAYIVTVNASPPPSAISFTSPTGLVGPVAPGTNLGPITVSPATWGGLGTSITSSSSCCLVSGGNLNVGASALPPGNYIDTLTATP